MHLILIFCIFTLSCSTAAQPEKREESATETPTEISAEKKYLDFFNSNTDLVSDGFDFPVGKPNAEGFYNAQGFGGKKHHLGDDWNGNAGGDNDLGLPIYAAANGLVSEAEDKKGGWGPVVRIVHMHQGKLYESLYAHCNEIFVNKGERIKRGQKIATIGNIGGKYLAHLHFEIRSESDMPLGGGYSKNNVGYLNPTEFIRSNRPQNNK